MKGFSKFIFNNILGWHVRGEFPDSAKCVIAVAPHTSNWDFLIAKLAYSSIGRTANFLIKAEWFVFPFNLFFKSLGGIPVTREKNSSLTDSLAAEFNRRDQMQLAITPEGTRKPIQEWKRGFYYIAFKAGVPILLVGLDYGKKEAISLGLIYPSGDYEKDIQEIKSRYKGIQAKKPGNFSL
ncbi:MAG: 1-acyl-sn-glycerol-3-phosphate acyltransferase [Proteiniphilum sp.]|uniref:1-acyl-sn-glycerol-3-phosphate acyltransferase n=1 Tax=Proteiniphilum sp. TaxID=1926877 RepID=UPI002B21D9BE|nr:1-acyl-sn-glycerol-3-phosphate acyltransferase [Proteiniphilum sp.]MEA5130149.1 1-acyl-sn-glycerol-3-phosphate acyltransferase [Proteiniphilum sp.]